MSTAPAAIRRLQRRPHPGGGAPKGYRRTPDGIVWEQAGQQYEGMRRRIDLADPHLPLADLLKGYRERSGLSQMELARRAEVCSSYIGRLESGDRPRCAPGAVAAIGRSLDLTPPELDRLAAAAGHVPPRLRELGVGDPTVAAVVGLLTDTRLSPAALADARATVETICARWGARAR